MAKIHKKTGNVCIVCDDELNECNSDNLIIFHKTRRQTHSTCIDCFSSFIQPVIQQSVNNIRKNIRKNADIVKCPGSFHCRTDNRCKKVIKLKDISVPDKISNLAGIRLDIFRIQYTISSPDAYLCPNNDCGQVVDVDTTYEGQELICSSCKTTWCRQCMISPFHTKKSCVEYEAENMKTENGKYIWEMKVKGVLKFCPQCHTPTIKHNGCNKIICSICSCKWCWLCVSMNIDYNHYDEKNLTGCSNKLWEGVDENGNMI